MSADERPFKIRPGRSRDAGAGSARKVQKLAAQVRRAAARAGHTPLRNAGRGKGTPGGRGRRSVASARLRADARRVVVKARVVRHKGAHYRAAPLAKHASYLERDGVTRDGAAAQMFDADGDAADRGAFAARCADDRHHFRLIVSPEDAGELEDLRRFTRELMREVAHDLDTRLDWVAIDHWNTDNPHVHILVRGIADDGTDLVIDRGYISEGLRHRAEERATLELGPRSEIAIHRARAADVEAERWTGLDRELQTLADAGAGLVDLRPGGEPSGEMRRLLLGRAASLERLGLASPAGPAMWTVAPGAEAVLRDLSVRGDIIKTMHKAIACGGRAFDPAALRIHAEPPAEPIVGRLVDRGLHDELEGTAYAIVDGADGRTHHLRFDDMELTSDAKPGAIVELRTFPDDKGDTRQSLAVRSDLPLAAQVDARGATWLDRQLVAQAPAASGQGFGREVREAMAARTDRLAAEGLARRQGGRLILASGLIATLRSRELAEAASAIAARTGLAHSPSAPGERVSGIYRERVTLSSGRFAMIDDGLGFQLVPWRPALEKRLGQQVNGTVGSGGIDWSITRGRGIGI